MADTTALEIKIMAEMSQLRSDLNSAEVAVYQSSQKMMDDVNGIGKDQIKISIDSSAAQAEIDRVKQSIGGVGESAIESSKEIDDVVKKSGISVDSMRAAMEARAKDIEGAFGGVKKSIGAVASAIEIMGSAGQKLGIEDSALRASELVDALTGKTGEYGDTVNNVTAFAGNFSAELGGLQDKMAGIISGQGEIAKSAEFASGALKTMGASAETAAMAVKAITAAAGILMAAFAGWQIGTELREKFVEVRVAGAAMVEGILTAWEGMGHYFNSSINSMKSVFFEFIGGVGSALKSIPGMGDAGKILSDISSASVAKIKTDQDQLKAVYQSSIAAIHDNLSDLAQYELGNSQKKIEAIKTVAQDEISADNDATEKIKANAKEKIDVFGQILDAIGQLTAKMQAEIDQTEKLTVVQQMEIKVMQDVASGKIKLSDLEKSFLEDYIKSAKAIEDKLLKMQAEQKQIDANSAANNKYIETLASKTESMVAANNAEIEGMKAIGLSKDALLQLSSARMEDKAAQLSRSSEMMKEIDSDVSNEYKKQAAVLRDLIVLKQKSAQMQESSAEWAKFIDGATQQAKGFFVDFFNNGSSAFSALGQSLKKQIIDQLAAMAAKAFVVNIVGNVTGSGVGGLAGVGGSGGLLNYASSALSGIELGGSTIGAIGNAVTTGLSKGFAGTAASFVGPVAPGFEIAASIGEFAAAAGPYALAIAGAAAAISAFTDNNVKKGGDYQYTAGQGVSAWQDSAGRQRVGTNGNEIGDATSQSLIQDGIKYTANIIDKTLADLGSKIRVQTIIGGGQSSSEKGEAYAYLGGTTSSGKSFGDTFDKRDRGLGVASPEQVVAEYKNEMMRATLGALQAATDIPARVSNQLQNVDVSKLSGAALDSLVGSVKQAANATNDTIYGMSKSVLDGVNSTVTDSTKMIVMGTDAATKAIAGIDVSSLANMISASAAKGADAGAAFSSAFGDTMRQTLMGSALTQVSQSVLSAIITPVLAGQQISDAAMSAVVSAAEAKMNALNAVFNSAGFAEMIAGLGKSMQPILASVNAAQATAGTTNTVAPQQYSTTSSAGSPAPSNADNERKSIQDQIDQLTLNSTQLLAKQRDALDSANGAIFDNLQALKNQDALKKVQETTEDARQAAQADIAEAQGNAVAATAMRQAAAIQKAVENLDPSIRQAAADSMALANSYAAQATEAKAAASAMTGLKSANDGLQVQLLQAQGNTVGASVLQRQQDLDKLTAGMSDADARRLTAQYDSNAGTKAQIALVQDQVKATDAAKAAWIANIDAQVKAAQQMSQAWTDVGTTLIDEAKKIRGEMTGGGAGGLAAAQADFAEKMAAAQAGNIDAAKALPQAASAMISAAQAMGLTGSNLRQIQGEAALALDYASAGAKGQSAIQTAQATSTRSQKMPQFNATIQSPAPVSQPSATSADIASLNSAVNTLIMTTQQQTGVLAAAIKAPSVVTVSGAVRTI